MAELALLTEVTAWLLVLGFGGGIGFYIGKSMGCVETMRKQTEIQRTQLEIQNRQTSHMKAEVQKIAEKEQGQKENERQDCWDGNDRIMFFWTECGTTVHNSKSCPEIRDSGTGTVAVRIKERPFCLHCLANTQKT